MRLKSAVTTLLLLGLGLGLSACYYAPGPGYYDSGYYYGSPYYYGSGYYGGSGYYAPSVGVYYSSGWRDRRWR